MKGSFREINSNLNKEPHNDFNKGYNTHVKILKNTVTFTLIIIKQEKLLKITEIIIIIIICAIVNHFIILAVIIKLIMINTRI